MAFLVRGFGDDHYAPLDEEMQNGLRYGLSCRERRFSFAGKQKYIEPKMAFADSYIFSMFVCQKRRQYDEQK